MSKGLDVFKILYLLLWHRAMGSGWFRGKCHELAQQWIALFDDGRTLVKKDGGANELGVWWNDTAGSTHLHQWEEVDKDLQNARDKGGDI